MTKPLTKSVLRGTTGIQSGLRSVRADNASDVMELITALNTDWAEFKATLETKDKELLKKFDDVVTTDKLERINASVGELQAAVDDANTRLAQIQTGAGGNDAPANAEYTDAFTAYFKSGDVQANLNEATDSEGGYLAPIEWDRTINDKLIEVSPMRQIAGQQTISGQGHKKVHNLRGTASGWVDESGARPETNSPTFGSQNFIPGEVYAMPGATQRMLDDAEINLENWLASEVETEFAYQEGLAFISGDGTNKPKGFLTYITGGANAADNPLGAIQLTNAVAAAAIDPDELVDLVYSLPSSFTLNARFTMNRTTQGEIRKLKDGNNLPIWQPSLAAGQPATLLGYPITEMPGMPNIATGTVPIAFGDFRRGYLIVDRKGISVLRDPFTAKPNVLFYTTKRVGGGVVNTEALKALKMA